VVKAVPGLGVGALTEREDLHRCDAEDEPLAAIGIAEHLAGDLEIPVELGLPYCRQPVDSQNISDFDSTSATSTHGRAAAPGSLNPSFNSMVGSVPGIDALLFRVSFDQLITR
jgi:hypothetical protein